jgi:hypothetical protein
VGEVSLQLVALAALILAGVSLGGCGKKTDPSRDNFERGMRTYLEHRGELCIGKSSWPIEVTASDVKMRTRDAVQMPVFEKMGLVKSTDLIVDTPSDDGPPHAVEVKRYELTEAGRSNWREHELGVNPAGQTISAGDFCVARFSLGKVVRWDVTKPTAATDPAHAIVSYTYVVDSPAWTKDPEVQRVLPAVARFVNGSGGAELEQPFTLTPDGWVADQLLPGDVRVTSNPPRPTAPGNN